MSEPAWLVMGLHLVVFFIAAMVCHARLAADRPKPEHLTEFYLWMSVGGVLGGVCNALLAPLLFNGVLEYHLGLIAAAYLGAVELKADRTKRQRQLDVLLPAGLAVLILALIYGIGVKQDQHEREPARAIIVFGVPALLCFLMSRRRLRFSLGVAAILLLSYFLRPGEGVQTVVAECGCAGGDDMHRRAKDLCGQAHQGWRGLAIEGGKILPPQAPHHIAEESAEFAVGTCLVETRCLGMTEFFSLFGVVGGRRC